MKEYTKGKYSVRLGYFINYEGVSVFSDQYRPNEDSFSCGLDRTGRFTAGVFDGVKTLQGGPIFPSPEITSGKFVSRFLAHTLMEYTDMPLREAFLGMNLRIHDLRDYIKPLEKVERTHLPAAGGTVVRIDPERGSFEYAFVGNTKLITELHTGEKILLSDKRNEECNKLFIESVMQLAQDANVSLAEFARTNAAEVERLKREHLIGNFNTEDGRGFGIFNGDAGIEKYINHGSYAIDDIKRVLMATDGIFPAMLDLSRQDDLTRVTDAAFRLGLVQVIQIKNRLNTHDPEWKNFPRISASDDATAIAFSISREKYLKQAYEAVKEFGS